MVALAVDQAAEHAETLCLARSDRRAVASASEHDHAEAEAGGQGIRLAAERAVFDTRDLHAAQLGQENVAERTMAAGEVDKAKSGGRSCLGHARYVQESRLRRMQRREVDRYHARDGCVSRTEIGHGETEEDADRRRIVLRLEVVVRLTAQHRIEVPAETETEEKAGVTGVQGCGAVEADPRAIERPAGE